MRTKPNGEPWFTCFICDGVLQVEYPGESEYVTINPKTGHAGKNLDDSDGGPGPRIICAEHGSGHDACAEHLTKEERNQIIEEADQAD